MLVQFSVGNFLSFKEIVTLSMVASSIKEHRETNVFKAKNSKIELLKSGVIYGANASGKSNFFKAMNFMANFIKNSSKEGQVGEEIDGVESFRLSTETFEKPSYFEIVFILENIMYRYGFEVDYKEVKSEWLYYAPKKTELELFTREYGEFNIQNSFEEGLDLYKKTRNNALFLSVVANFGGEFSTKILQWFKQFNIISGLDDNYFSYTRKQLKNDNFKKELIDLVHSANLGIDDIESDDDDGISKSVFEDIVKKLSPMTNNTDIGIRINNFSLDTLHKKYDSNNKFVGYEKFQLFHHESEGTKKLFSLFGPIIDTLKVGKIIVIDELDAKLHPLLTRFIIELFHSNNHNSNNAQLIFNSHDTNLLSNHYFRRDQIWFSEKDEYGSTDLYSLVDYKVRNDASYEKNYLLGKYGSIPYIGSFHFYQEEKDGGPDGE
jgi:AAA15 family ATPase/GTPase